MDFQIETIEDTMRQVANYMDARDRGTCLKRQVMLCWNWLHDALHDVPQEETRKNGIMYRMKVGQIPGDENKRIKEEEA